MAIAYDECIKEELTQTKIDVNDPNSKYVIEINENGDYIFNGGEILDPTDENFKESEYYKLVVKPAQDAAADAYFKESEKYSFL